MVKVLLYYKFINLDDPKALRDAQFEFCKAHNLKGRILISQEGLNGTVSGIEDQIEAYKIFTEEAIGKVEWKESFADVDVFPKLRVVVRDEIVTFKHKVDLKKAANYIEPEELKNLYETGKDFIIVDGRNEYEARIGKFKNAIVPKINAFRDFPSWFEENRELFKGKLVITYCTGGIRCEKLSAYLVEQGIDDVQQLHGGIVKYGEVTGGKDFEGTCYVFDHRIHVPVNSINPEIISKCHHCGKKIARYINCCNAECNKQIICCKECDAKFAGGCSEECKKLSRHN